MESDGWGEVKSSESVGAKKGKIPRCRQGKRRTKLLTTPPSAQRANHQHQHHGQQYHHQHHQQKITTANNPLVHYLSDREDGVGDAHDRLHHGADQTLPNALKEAANPALQSAAHGSRDHPRNSGGDTARDVLAALMSGQNSQESTGGGIEYIGDESSARAEPAEAFCARYAHWMCRYCGSMRAVWSDSDRFILLQLPEIA